MLKKIIVLFFIFKINTCFSQYIPIDTIYGNVKEVYETIVYPHITKEASIDGDDYEWLNNYYGEFGFPGSKDSKELTHFYWYHTSYNHYINNRRFYDKNRNLIKEYWHDQNYEKINTYNYTYNQNKLVASIDSSSYSIQQNFINETEDNEINEIEIRTDIDDRTSDVIYSFKKFDKNLLVSQKKVYYGRLMISYFKYDENDNMVEEINYVQNSENYLNAGDEKLVLRYITKNSYNEYNKLENSITEYMVDGVLKKERGITHKYDVNNFISESHFFEGSLNRYMVYKYDGLNRLLERTTLNSKLDSLPTTETYFYDENNNIIKLLYTTTSDTNYKINETKNVLFEYIFDDLGNWVSIAKKIGGKVSAVRLRQIYYY